VKKCQWSINVNDPACLDPQGQIVMQVANAIMAISKGPGCVPDADGCSFQHLPQCHGACKLTEEHWRELVQVASDIANISNGKRCVPDGAMDADPNSGYNIIVGGKQITLGGTVSVPP
jgi:hypothetical protein